MAKRDLEKAGEGQILEVSRRFVTLVTEGGRVVTGKLSSKSLDFVVGDNVSFESRDGELFVTEGTPALRCLRRTFHGSLKRMGANIDLLCVIAACGATWNTAAIDRMLVAGAAQDIPSVLVLNKVDLGLDELAPQLAVYEEAGVSVVRCSAKRGDGIERVRQLLDQDGVRVMALCGVSGVGKSSILNTLIPDARSRTGEVSDRTGQGKQTTSQPRGYLYQRVKQAQKIVIDLPGVQYFGLSHLEPLAVSRAFSEIASAASGCRFRDCKHTKERDCAVRAGVESGAIAEWRYESYLRILEEIDNAREY
ncbi:MAG: ribosome small subunit-dependent GTPase A [Pseudomonadota bacterium]